MDTGDLITVQEAAEMLGVVERTVYRYQDEEVLPVLRVGDSRARFTSRDAVVKLRGEMEERSA